MGHIEGMDMFCAPLAFIDGVGAPEMVLIFVVVLVLFGGQKLPEFARGLGKSIREFKKAAAGVEEEFKRALEEDERKHATPQLPAPAPDPTLAAAAAADHAGPSVDHHDTSIDHEVLADEMPLPDHASAPADSTTPPATDPTILPPATGVASAAPTPPKPVAPAPASDYPENPS